MFDPTLLVFFSIFIGISTSLRLTNLGHQVEGLGEQNLAFFDNFMNEKSPEEISMVQGLLENDYNELWQGLKNNNLTGDQEGQLIVLLMKNSDDFREQMVNRQIAEDEIFNYLKDLDKDEQVEEAKIILRVYHNDLTALFQSRHYRQATINNLLIENPELNKIKNLDEEHQRKVLELLYKVGSSADGAQKQNYIKEILNNQLLKGIFMSEDVPAAAHLSQKHALSQARSIKHTLKGQKNI